MYQQLLLSQSWKVITIIGNNTEKILCTNLQNWYKELRTEVKGNNSCYHKFKSNNYMGSNTEKSIHENKKSKDWFRATTFAIALLRERNEWKFKKKN